MIATVTVSPLGALAAFGAGIVSFLSPCVLPLVPGYLSMVSGLSAAELEAIDRGASRRAGVLVTDPVLSPPAGIVQVPDPTSVQGLVSTVARPTPTATATATATLTVLAPASATTVVEAPVPPPARATAPGGSMSGPAGAAAPQSYRALVRGIGLFVLGFTVVFVSLGAAASGIGTLLDSHKHVLTLASGALVVVFGAVMLVGSLPGPVWSRLGSGVSTRIAGVVGERRFALRPSALGAWAPPVLGMAFAFAWTPCIGPVLGVLLTLAGERSHLAGGVMLLFAYSLGLGVPFVATGLAFGRLTSLFARARRGLWVVHLIGGLVLVAFGALLVTGNLGWLSAQFTALLDHLGLHGLTSS